MTANTTTADPPNRRAYSSASRKLVVRTRSAQGWRFTQAVSRATHGLDQAAVLVFLIELGAEATDVRLNDRCVRVEMKVPDMLEQHGSRNKLSRMPHQIFEQAKLTRLELDYTVAAPDNAPQ